MTITTITEHRKIGIISFLFIFFYYPRVQNIDMFAFPWRNSIGRCAPFSAFHVLGYFSMHTKNVEPVLCPFHVLRLSHRPICRNEQRWKPHADVYIMVPPINDGHNVIHLQGALPLLCSWQIVWICEIPTRQNQSVQKTPSVCMCPASCDCPRAFSIWKGHCKYRKKMWTFQILDEQNLEKWLSHFIATLYTYRLEKPCESW